MSQIIKSILVPIFALHALALYAANPRRPSVHGLLPEPQQMVEKLAWQPQKDGRVQLRSLGSERVDVVRDEGSIQIRLRSSAVMQSGLYFDTKTSSLSMPGIVAVDAPDRTPSKNGRAADATQLTWSATETYNDDPAALTFKIGSVTLARGKDAMCQLTARFRKTVQGTSLVDEDFVLRYRCPGPAPQA